MQTWQLGVLCPCSAKSEAETKDTRSTLLLCTPWLAQLSLQPTCISYPAGTNCRDRVPGIYSSTTGCHGQQYPLRFPSSVQYLPFVLHRYKIIDTLSGTIRRYAFHCAASVHLSCSSVPLPLYCIGYPFRCVLRRYTSHCNSSVPLPLYCIGYLFRCVLRRYTSRCTWSVHLSLYCAGTYPFHCTRHFVGTPSIVLRLYEYPFHFPASVQLRRYPFHCTTPIHTFSVACCFAGTYVPFSLYAPVHYIPFPMYCLLCRYLFRRCISTFFGVLSVPFSC